VTRPSALAPDQFLYDRKGPWPQPSPAHPLLEAPEVLNVPADEWQIWNATIGARYLKTQMGQPPLAAAYAVENRTYLGPDDATFDRILFETGYTRFLRPIDDDDRKKFGPLVDFDDQYLWRKYDFRAMKVVEPLDGLYCAPAAVLIREDRETGERNAVAIALPKIVALPEDPAWTMAKAFALQGAAYHMLFVVHPALHFPMDSVNAVTKTAIPMQHPIFQMLYPHTTYSLALNNAVLESDQSVVNNNAAGTWFDPLTGDGYNLKLLFGAGYAGIAKFGDSYPQYDYMKPQKGEQWGMTSPYLQALQAYYEPFEAFTTVVAKRIFETPSQHAYVKRWGNYLHANVHGFPTGTALSKDADLLAQVMAIYMWDVSVSHGADHYSFGTQVAVRDKMLRIRVPPPEHRKTPPPDPTKGEVIANADDLYRASVCQQMFFLPFVIEPSLNDLAYPLLDPVSFEAMVGFKKALVAVDEQLKTECPHGGEGTCCFQPLQERETYPNPIGVKNYTPGPFDPTPAQLVIPSTIQY
jgi:hypothetical protein